MRPWRGPRAAAACAMSRSCCSWYYCFRSTGCRFLPSPLVLTCCFGSAHVHCSSVPCSIIHCNSMHSHNTLLQRCCCRIGHVCKMLPNASGLTAGPKCIAAPLTGWRRAFDGSGIRVPRPSTEAQPCSKKTNTTTQMQSLTQSCVRMCMCPCCRSSSRD
jgi:hypothetical protein